MVHHFARQGDMHGRCLYTFVAARALCRIHRGGNDNDE